MSKKTKRKNKSYSSEFKLQVVRDIEHNYLSYPEVRNKYFPYAKSPQNLKFVRKWIKIYQDKGVEGLMEERRGRKPKRTHVKESGNSEAATMKDLLKENERLRAENEYLKKLDALIQKKAIEQKSK